MIYKTIGKIVVAIMGATNTAFSILTPVAIALMMISVFPLSTTNGDLLLIAAMVSTLYRGLKFLIFMGEKDVGTN